MNEDIQNVTEEVNENVETQPTEQIEEGIELTDTTNETVDEPTEEENAEVRKSLRELLEEDPTMQEELDGIFDRRFAKIKRDHEKELSKYKNTEKILKTGLQTETIDDANDKLMSFYKEQGIEIPALSNGLSDSDMARLGTIEADEMAELGISEMTKEANRLANIGYNNLDAREKATFMRLADLLESEKQTKELKNIGVDPSLLENKEFKEFRKQFNPQTSIKDIYDLYSKLQPKKKVEPIGSMKTDPAKTKKDFYTAEEVEKNPELLNDPAVYEIVKQSMAKW